MKPIVAIDIGSYLTKVVQIVPGKTVNELSVLKFLRTPLTKEGEIDKEAFFAQLESVIPLSRLRSSELCVMLPAASVNYAHFNFPKLPKNELARAVIAEAKKKILPAPAPHDSVKYIIQKEVKVKDAIQLSIFTGAADKIAIDKYYSLFKQKGAIPVFVGAPEICLYGLFMECCAQAQQHFAMIHVGFKCTTLAIFLKGQIVLTRNIPFAGNDIIGAIAKQTKAEVEQVSQLFVRGEIDAGILLPHWNYLLTEIRRSFAYYKNIDTSADIQTILISGGVGALASASAYLKEHMRGSVEVLDLQKLKSISFKRLAGENIASLSPFFALGIGAALAYKSGHVLMNFLPEEAMQRKKERHVDALLLKLGVSVTGILLCIAAVAGIMVQQNNARAFPVAKRESVRLKLESVQKGAEQVQQRQKQLNQQIIFIDNIKKYELPWYTVVSTLGQTVSSDKLVLRDITVSYEIPPKQTVGFYKIAMRGAITADFEAASLILDTFIKNLEQSGIFKDIKCTPLVLEEIVQDAKAQQGRMISGQNGRLTAEQERAFSVEAQIVRK